MQNISEDILIQASEGEMEAFEKIYKATSDFVYNIAFRIVNDKEDAEEVTQEVFLTIYRKLKSFSFQSSFKTWVYRITVNSAINYYKKKSREFNRMNEYKEVLEFTNETKANDSKGHQKEMITSLLKVLNPDQRACLVLRSIEGLSYQEIAESLKININTVRSRLKRAREILFILGKGVVKNEM